MSVADSVELQRIRAAVESALTTSPAAAGKTATATFTPAAAAYLANDCISIAQALAFGAAAAGEFMITSAVLEVDTTALQSGETSYNLQIYNVTPPSAHADNDAWDLPSGDRAAHIATIPLGTPVDLGSTLKVETDGINKQITIPSGGTVYAELVTVGAFTATAVARKVALHGTPI